MNRIQITKEDFMRRFAASRKRKKELVELLQQELMNEHKLTTGFTATNIYVM